MRALIQRTQTPATVTVNEKVVGKIQKGFVVFLGVGTDDNTQDLEYIASKIPNLRIFSDPDGKMNLSLIDTAGEILLISQFTLMANMSGSGRRPSFSTSARPEVAEPLYKKLGEIWREKGIHVAIGIFGADMKVNLTNDGPVTLWLDSRAR